MGVVLAAAVLVTIFVLDAIFGSCIWQNILLGCRNFIRDPLANFCRRKKVQRQRMSSAVNQEARNIQQDIELRAAKPPNPRRASPRPTVNDAEVANEREEIDLTDLIDSPRASTEGSPVPEPARGRCLTRRGHHVARPDTPDLYSASPRASVAASATTSVLSVSAAPRAAAPSAARSASVVSVPASSMAGTPVRSRSIDYGFPHHRDSVITSIAKASGEAQLENQTNRRLGRDNPAGRRLVRDIIIPAFKDAAKTLVEQKGSNGKFAEQFKAKTAARRDAHRETEARESAAGKWRDAEGQVTLTEKALHEAEANLAQSEKDRTQEKDLDKLRSNLHRADDHFMEAKVKAAEARKDAVVWDRETQKLQLEALEKKIQDVQANAKARALKQVNAEAKAPAPKEQNVKAKGQGRSAARKLA